MKTLTLKLKWENEKSFEFTEDENDKVLSIIKVEENGNIATLWPQIQKICCDTFNSKMEAIGQEMAKP